MEFYKADKDSESVLLKEHIDLFITKLVADTETNRMGKSWLPFENGRAHNPGRGRTHTVSVATNLNQR